MSQISYQTLKCHDTNAPSNKIADEYGSSENVGYGDVGPMPSSGEIITLDITNLVPCRKNPWDMNWGCLIKFLQCRKKRWKTVPFSDSSVRGTARVHGFENVRAFLLEAAL